ncbi:hypothetical protein Leryth_002388 [Lithospermum erythrorhizon]|nr:hypothetical protein Leryth_002388 [Lithospermum erythrorhizon]
MCDGIEESMGSYGEGLRRSLGSLRGVKWRMDLGILPTSPSVSVNDLRRLTADSRRRYASLRRQLLVDSHVSKDGSSSPDSIACGVVSSKMLSWSGWLTKTCLGMHELLAPLLYVLHVDVEYLVQVRELYEDYFTDKFDGFSFHENDLTYKFDFKEKFRLLEQWNRAENIFGKISCLGDLDPNKQVIVLINDAYGAEGELGILLSDKFIEHDAFCMFDALMNGAGGAVSMAEFFSSPPRNSLHSGFPPVIEASASLYHLLSIADSSIHTHLVELAVEPQYFALRWLRVLFGREFALESLLSLWDEIFACENRKLGRSPNDDTVSCCAVLDSSRGAFISAFAVSMIVYMRSSLLATENATLCLQRLLNFPEDANLGKLVKKAKSLQALAMEANNTTPLLIHAGFYDGSKSLAVRSNCLLLESSSPRTLNLVPESYWEERWRDLQKEEHVQGAIPQVPVGQKSWSQTVRMRFSRTISDPFNSMIADRRTNSKSSVRRSLLNDLARQLGADESSDEIESGEDLCHNIPVGFDEADNEDNSVGHMPERRYSSYSSGDEISEENSSISIDPPSPRHGQASGNSIGASCSPVDDSDANVTNTAPCENNTEEIPLPISDHPNDIMSLKNDHKNVLDEKSTSDLKERKFLSGKFQWLWKFGRNLEEGTCVKEAVIDSAKSCNVVNNQCKISTSSTSEGCNIVSIVSGISKGETVDQNLMITIKNLGQSMLENIQVIETVFQQDKSQTGRLENFSKNGLVGKGQVKKLSGG